MRFSYAEAMTDPDFYLPLAQAAEDAGYHRLTVADSICYPQESNSIYPYTADGSRDFLEDKPFPEPFIIIAAMGAVTNKIRFTPFVLKLPVRPPVFVAKQAASLAALTNNRLELGVGLSPWREDFEVMGVPFVKRGKRMDESIDIIRGLTAGDYFGYHGEIFNLPRIKINPVSSEPIPILIGGHSDAALRRAAVRGDGWMHAGSDPQELDRLLRKLHQFREEAGTTDRSFAIHVISPDGYTTDGIKRLEDKGVTDVVVALRNFYSRDPDTETLDTKIAKLRSYADSIITRTA